MRSFISSPPGLISVLGLLVLIVWRGLFVALPPDLNPLAPLSVSAVLATQIVISMVVLIACLYIILSQKYESDTEKWAYGAVGIILGYWLPA
jgi:hypothetical protein